ncbi:MAG: alkaline phosphatase family protein [Saprospiraceae bacterium]|nr:alkaline phosphatase family protein [Saprospiraceae bacterium]
MSYKFSFSFLLVMFLVTSLAIPLVSQKEFLQSGPMLGPVAMREAIVWVQTKKSAKVKISYKLKGVGTSWVFTPEISTGAENAYSGQFTIAMLEPGQSYSYRLFINGIRVVTDYPLEFSTQDIWAFRKDPPDFKFIAGSCFYVNDEPYDRPGKPYGGEYSILKHIKDEKADFMVWLGDNIYLREPDFDSKSGIWYRNTHTRSLPELQPVLAAMPHYAIWDDHDYGPNDSDWTYPLKSHALEAFKTFWPNNAYGAGHTDGVTSSFVWNDCQFFMLDDRWYRNVERENGSVLGEQQKFWFLEAIRASKATFKFVAVGSQFLSDALVYENMANYPNEREEIINFLDQNNISGVVFLTGDRHHSELTKLKTEKGNVFYDVTSSALTSGTGMHLSEKNTLRVEDSMIGVRNFAVLSVKGPRKERTLNLSYKDSSGNLLKEFILDFK